MARLGTHIFPHIFPATRCNKWQHTATHCNNLLFVWWRHGETRYTYFPPYFSCNTLQQVATHCNTLQHTATICFLCGEDMARLGTYSFPPYFPPYFLPYFSCNTLQQMATHCNTMQPTATQCNTMCCLERTWPDWLHILALCFIFPYIFPRIFALIFPATRCNTLQHTATHCNTLQHTATHCTTLHHTATHCNTLPHFFGCERT